MATERKGGGMTLALRKLDIEIDPHAAKIIALGRVLDEFRKRDLNMPVAQIQAFLMVALDAGLGMTEIANTTGTKESTTSRYLLEMGPPRLQGDSNLALVERSTDPMDTRRARYKLTRKGRQLADAICKALEETGL